MRNVFAIIQFVIVSTFFVTAVFYFAPTGVIERI